MQNISTENKNKLLAFVFTWLIIVLMLILSGKINFKLTKFSANDLIKEIKFKIFKEIEKKEEKQETEEKKKTESESIVNVDDIIDNEPILDDIPPEPDDFFSEDDPPSEPEDDTKPLPEVLLGPDLTGAQYDFEDDGTERNKGRGSDDGGISIQYHHKTGTGGRGRGGGGGNSNGFGPSDVGPKKERRDVKIPKIESVADISKWLRKNFSSEIQKWIPKNEKPISKKMKTLLGHQRNDISAVDRIVIDNVPYQIFLSYTQGQDDLRICLIYDDVYVRLITSGIIKEGTNLFEIGKIIWSKSKKGEISFFQGSAASPKAKKAKKFYKIFLKWYNTNVAG